MERRVDYVQKYAEIAAQTADNARRSVEVQKGISDLARKGKDFDDYHAKLKSYFAIHKIFPQELPK